MPPQYFEASVPVTSSALGVVGTDQEIQDIFFLISLLKGLYLGGLYGMKCF